MGANQDPYLLHLANRLTSLIEDPMQRFDDPTEQAHYDAGVRAVAKVMKPSCRRARAPPSGVHARGHRPALVARRPDRPACHVDNARTEGFNRTIQTDQARRLRLPQPGPPPAPYPQPHRGHPTAEISSMNGSHPAEVRRAAKGRGTVWNPGRLLLGEGRPERSAIGTEQEQGIKGRLPALVKQQQTEQMSVATLRARRPSGRAAAVGSQRRLSTRRCG